MSAPEGCDRGPRSRPTGDLLADRVEARRVACPARRRRPGPLPSRRRPPRTVTAAPAALVERLEIDGGRKPGAGVHVALRLALDRGQRSPRTVASGLTRPVGDQLRDRSGRSASSSASRFSSTMRRAVSWSAAARSAMVWRTSARAASTSAARASISSRRLRWAKRRSSKMARRSLQVRSLSATADSRASRAALRTPTSSVTASRLASASARAAPTIAAASVRTWVGVGRPDGRARPDRARAPERHGHAGDGQDQGDGEEGGGHDWSLSLR